MTIIPVASTEGSAIITITVSDGESMAYDTFELRVVEYRMYLPLVIRNG